VADVERARVQLDLLREAETEAPPTEISIRCFAGSERRGDDDWHLGGSPGGLLAAIRAYESVGCDRIVLDLPQDRGLDFFYDELRWIADATF
jgi:hypothetical protein